jgi:predicted dehydrogenase
MGCGQVVQTLYTRTLSAVPELRVTRVSDLHAGAARDVARALGAAVVDSDGIMEQVDAVLVATPPDTHFEIVDAALGRVGVVFCEKPFVGSPAEAVHLVTRAASLGCCLKVGHFRRVFPTLNVARALIATGTWGPVRHLSVVEGHRLTWQARTRYTERASLGGVLYDTGSHAMDMALYAAGLDTVTLECHVARVERDRPEPSSEVQASGVLHAPSHDVGFDVRFSRTRLLANRVRVTLERATLDIPVMPGPGLRIWGPGATTVVGPPSRLDTFEQCFVRQWQLVFDLAQGGERFDAQRFVTLTHWLWSIATGQ